MSKIAQDNRRPSIFLRERFNAILWPNGECVLARPRTKKTAETAKTVSEDMFADKLGLKILAETACNAEVSLASYMGLSIRPIFDSEAGEVPEGPQGNKKSRQRKGLTGITSYGKRMVRNATHVLEERYGRARCIFATVTLPDVPLEQMSIIHERWHRLVEYYRLGIRRELQKQNLSGEIVTVSEVQEKRYEKTNLPVLHLHSVFIGVNAWGKFAISTERHDDIWVNAVKSVVDVKRDEFTTACNLQRVRKSSSAYLGKYMSKGTRVVARIVNQGLGDWLPKHWWNCSRSLSAEVKGNTRIVNDFSNWLYDMAYTSGQDVWRWHSEVLIELKSGKKVLMALYGRIDPFVAAQMELTTDPW